MALWRCRRCTTRYAVGLGYCPQCTSTDYEEDGEDVAKITTHGGPSDQLAEPGQPGYQPPAEEAQGEAETQAAQAEPEAELTVAELRARLRQLGLPSAGAKDELAHRLADSELSED